MFEKYFKKEVLERAKNKKLIIGNEFDEKENLGVYFIEGTDTWHLVFFESDNVKCSCIGSEKGLCSHIYLVCKHLVENKILDENKVIEILEKYKSEVKNKNGEGN